MNILVIGGNGFIGSHLVDYLLSNGHNVRVYDISYEKFRKPLINVDYRISSLENISDLYESLLNIDIVYHLASTSVPSSSNIDPISDINTNLITTLNILNLVVKLGIKRFVFFSSGGAVYGDPLFNENIPEDHQLRPISSYGIVKSTIENYLFLFKKLHNIRPLILRPSNAYGPRQGHFQAHGVISTFLRKIKMNESLTVYGDGLSTKDYIYVSDIVEICYKLSLSDNDGIYNIGSGEGTSINQIIDKIKKVTGKDPNINYTDSQVYDVNHFVLDISKIKDELNWIPSISLDTGIKQVWDSINEIE
jgi:UDP-glucose 4-epimerase